MSEMLIPLLRPNDDVAAHAIVDLEDYEDLAAYRWTLSRTKSRWQYAVRRDVRVEGVKQKDIRMHRVILGLASDDSRFGDHINGNTLDNRRSNLRIVTPQQNQQNRHYGYGKSPHRGVVQHVSGLWQARVKINGRFHSVGYFKTDDEAGAAASLYRAQHMPFSPDAREEVSA